MDITAFSALSTEAFDVLAQYLEAKDIVMLLTTGNRFLRSAVQQRGSVSTIKATFTRDPLKWPEFFERQPRLRHLFVQYAPFWDPRDSSTLLTTQTLLTLPNTLRSIHLGLPAAESVWLDSDGNFAFEINGNFPFMQSISLCGKPSWTDKLMKHLPPSLLVLRLHKNDRITETALIDLPRGLEELEIPLSILAWCDYLDQVLPPNIHTLIMNCHRPTKEAIIRLRMIPSLKNLNLVISSSRGHEFDEHLMNRTKAALNELPSQLTALTLDCVSPSYYATYMYLAPATEKLIFPSNLTSLKLRRVFSDIPMDYSELPSSLTSLEVARNFGFYNAGYHVYEQHLLPINAGQMPFDHRYSKLAETKGLPNSITFLDFSSTCLVQRDLPHLPPRLTFLQCLIAKNLNVTTFLEHLPQTLRVLRVPGLSLNGRDLILLPPSLNEIALIEVILNDDFLMDLFNDQSEIYKRQKTHFSTLSPKTLAQAALSLLPIVYHTWKPLPWKYHITSEVISNLPARITTVCDLESIQPGNQQPELTTLPLQLTTIHLPKAAYFWPTESELTLQWPTELTILNLPVDYSIPAAQIACLPRSLTVLVLPWNEDISDDEVSALPPSLVHLDLAYNNLITNDAIPMLPRTLTRLSLWNNTLVSGECFSQLPRGLIELTMARARIEPKDFASVPPKIQILNIGNGRHFDLPDYKVLPTSLRTIQWQWTVPQFNACKSHLPHLVVASSLISCMKETANKEENKFWDLHDIKQ